jgi:cell division protein FtsN
MARRNVQAYRDGSGNALPFWVWLLIGLVLGFGLAALAFHQGWVPELRDSRGPRPEARAEPPATGDRDSRPTAESEPRRRFDFYTVLPEMETVVSAEELRQEAAQAPAGTTAERGSAAEPRGRLYLQAASFRSAAEAEQMKARLALLGLRAQVVPVNVNGVDWFRVRAGPFDDARAIEGARATIEANGIRAIVVRPDGG